LTLLVNSGGESAVAEWQAHFKEAAPHLDVRWWGDQTIPPADVRYALVWEPDPGRLAALPNLQLILSTAAGVDHITRDPTWPRHIPLVRMGGDETAQRMGEFVCMAALSLLRDFRRVTLAQAERRWDYFENPRCAFDVRVGVMGLGNLGTRSAAMLAALGFQVAGWSRTRKVLPGIECYAGAEEQAAFLGCSDILVCLLPDTVDTRGAIRAETIAQLPPGAAVINVARGGHVVLDDLLAALDSGYLSGALLDVFETEPLPASHPVWGHPRVTVTPHMASLASRRARAHYVADAIEAFERGGDLPNLYDPNRGY
jgi:glyoxylate/hydroxypyruvate reductase